MGHLAPFLRLASALSSHNCEVTLITPRPTVSASESRNISALLSAFPRIRPIEFRIPHYDALGADPFYAHNEAMRASAHGLLSPLLSSLSPAPSAIVIDISLASAFIPASKKLNLRAFVFFTSSATMLSLFAYYPRNGRALVDAEGIVLNTFEALEGDTLAALNGGRVLPGLPPVTAVGPLEPFAGGGLCARVRGWLDRQPARSVVYVSFGSRAAMSEAQIEQLGIGLERSGCGYVWVVKTKAVDREERAEEAVEVREKGVVVREWVEQEAILAHEAVALFVSHCGWNSVTEAALRGVRVLAWPLGMDQMSNAGTVERCGLGKWRGWGGGGDGEVVVGGEEIGEVVREMVAEGGGAGAGVGVGWARVGEEARRAVGVGGSSYAGLVGLIEEFGRASL
ncbi:Anthocyanidin 3-O-glucosyltransferase 5 [Acorus calamus]|uniref:Anthocyanidin 3-O-glucosyltransferase 5 n=1 Tax=Acorus calamus TaxID=4465 RepID=A0AAV9EDX3_ACOCL|nr:Anthocyanidin 3-O-glucosyltransferase 5 [Acorus calamus]